LVGLSQIFVGTAHAQRADMQTADDMVRVGVYQNAPRIFFDDSGNPAGFWVDLLEAIAKDERWFLEYVPCEWESCLLAVEQGQLDLMVDVAYSEERDRRFDFNQKVVFVSWSEVYAQPGTGFASLLDLDQKRVAVLRDGIQQTALQERAESLDITIRIVPVDDFHKVFQQLENGDVDAGVVNRFFGAEMASQYNVERTSVLFQPSFIHVVAAEGKQARLLGAIDAALAEMDGNPRSAYHRARERWLEPQPPLSGLEMRQVFFGIIVYMPLVALAAFFFWNHKLRQEIDRRQQAEMRLQTLADNTPGVIYQYMLRADGSDELLYISSGSIDLWGVEAEAALHDVNRLWEKVNPEDLAKMRASVLHSAETLTYWNFEWRITNASGQQKWLQASARPRRKRNGDTIWDGLILDVSDRKYAEAQTEEVWQRLELATQSAHMGIWDYNPVEDRLILDDRLCEIYGIDPTVAQWRLEDWQNCLHPEDRLTAIAEVEAALTEAHEYHTEFRVITTAGDIRYIESHAVILQDEDGKIQRMIGVNWDISDRKRAETALRESERRFQNMAANVPGAIFKYVMHPDGTSGVTYMSPGCYGLWEVDAEAVVEDAAVLWNMVHPDDLPAMYESVLASARTLQPWVWQWRITTPSGKNKWLEAAGRPLLQENGDVVWDTLIMDVSDRKRTEAALQASEVRYRKVVETQTDFILHSRPDTTITFANNALCRALGLPPDEVIGKKWSDFANPNDLEEEAFVELARLTPENPRCFVTNRDARADGQEGWTQWLNEGIFDELGQLVEIQSVGRDITELKQIEQALKTSEERLRLVTENMRDLVCLHHPDGRYLYVTPSSQVLLGYPPEELIGCTPYDFFHPDDQERIRQEAHQRNLEGNPSLITYRIRQKNGNYIWLETLTQAILDERGQIQHLQTTSRDVSDRVKAQQQLEHDALHDGLTGLPNRSLLMARLTCALQRAKLHPESRFAVLFLDLDNFKVVNDSLGHLVGDELLLVVAEQLGKLIGEADLAARLGGDEFVILLEDVTEMSEAVRIAERILEGLGAPFLVGDRDVFTSTSIGIVIGDATHQSAENLLRDADLAMYRAKQSGRGCYAIFDPTMHLQVVERLHLESDLRKALENQEFILYYQPLVDLQTLAIRGFEVLIRWQHPRRGLVSPIEFIPVVEEMGLIVALGQWVLHTACCQAAVWQASFPQNPPRIAVNLSVQQLQPDLLRQLDAVLQQTGLPSDRLVLEITEGMLIQNIEMTCDLLNQLKSKGVRLSIDDFGTGYSSLRYLHQLPVDTLKIDRSFISPVVSDARNQVIAESVVALSNLLELKAIAEGIETLDQLKWLQTIGCELGQGYLFAPPLPVHEATLLLYDITLPFPTGTSSSIANRARQSQN